MVYHLYAFLRVTLNELIVKIFYHIGHIEKVYNLCEFVHAFAYFCNLQISCHMKERTLVINRSAAPSVNTNAQHQVL